MLLLALIVGRDCARGLLPGNRLGFCSVGLVCLLVLGAIGLSMAGTKTETAQKDPGGSTDSGEPQLGVGDHAVLSEDGFGCASEDKVEAFSYASAIKDEYGAASLFDSGECVQLKAKTHVLVLGYGQVGKGRLDESRILDGPKSGRVAWIFEGELTPTTQRHKIVPHATSAN